MAENFYTILTMVGHAKIANSQVTGEKVELTEMAVGDGNGSYYNPTQTQTELRNEVWRGNIASITVDENNPNWIVIEGVIPSSVGGFFVREVGIFDAAGDMLAIGKYPETYKPVTDQGSAKDLYIRMIIEVTNASAVQLKIDPSVIIASRKYVDDKSGEAEQNAKNYTDQQVSQLQNILNDLENSIGDLSNLTTDQKANLVAAVNELKTKLDNLDDATGQSLAQLMNALNDLISELATHLADNTRHITQQERSNWNAKQDALAAEQKRYIYIGTEEPSPSLGNNGDIYFQYKE